MNDFERSAGAEDRPIEPAAEEQMTQPIEVSMQGQTLYINGAYMQWDAADANMLKRALAEGREEIIQGLEAFKAEILRRDPSLTVRLAPFKVVDLGMMKDGNLSPLGKAMVADDDQILGTPEAVAENIRPLWDAVEFSGYTPTVRAFRGIAHNVRAQGVYAIDLWAELPKE